MNTWQSGTNNLSRGRSIKLWICNPMSTESVGVFEIVIPVPSQGQKHSKEESIVI